jgi:hypothetical protein
MRAVVEAAAQGWRGRPVHVACSGNFTVERIIARCGVGQIHSNDVSIYSCALGWHLTGEGTPYTVKQPEFAWLADFLAPGLPTVATLLLAGEMLKAGKDSAYAQRMRAEYTPRTLIRLDKAMPELGIPAGQFYDVERNKRIINDVVEVRDGKVWLFETPVADLANPKDTIINPETLVPPGVGAAGKSP